MTELAVDVGVDAESEFVWRALKDLGAVLTALPGISVEDVEADGSHHGTLRLPLDGAVGVLRGTVRVDSVDEPGRRLMLRARGAGARGAGQADLLVEVADDAGERPTRLHISGECAVVAGDAAVAIGSPRDYAASLVEALAAALAKDPPAPAVPDAAVGQAVPTPSTSFRPDIGAVFGTGGRRPNPFLVAAAALTGMALGRRNGSTGGGSGLAMVGGRRRSVRGAR